MTGRLNPLNPLIGKIERYEQSDRELRQWDSSRVEWTLNRLKLESARREIRSASSDGLYSFEEFNRVVEFPMELFGESLSGDLPIHKNPRTIHPMWFKSFVGLPFVRAYEERFSMHIVKNPNRPLGMIFPRKGFSQGLILHNGDWDMFVPPQSSCHLFKGGKKHAMTLVVQPYMGFIDHFKKNLM